MRFINVIKVIFQVHNDILLIHSRLSKNQTKSLGVQTGTLQGEKALFGGPEYGVWEILANVAGQK